MIAEPFGRQFFLRPSRRIVMNNIYRHWRARSGEWFAAVPGADI